MKIPINTKKFNEKLISRIKSRVSKLANSVSALSDVVPCVSEDFYRSCCCDCCCPLPDGYTITIPDYFWVDCSMAFTHYTLEEACENCPEGTVKQITAIGDTDVTSYGYYYCDGDPIYLCVNYDYESCTYASITAPIVPGQTGVEIDVSTNPGPVPCRLMTVTAPDITTVSAVCCCPMSGSFDFTDPEYWVISGAPTDIGTLCEDCALDGWDIVKINFNGTDYYMCDDGLYEHFRISWTDTDGDDCVYETPCCFGPGQTAGPLTVTYPSPSTDLCTTLPDVVTPDFGPFIPVACDCSGCGTDGSTIIDADWTASSPYSTKEDACAACTDPVRKMIFNGTDYWACDDTGFTFTLNLSITSPYDPLWIAPDGCYWVQNPPTAVGLNTSTPIDIYFGTYNSGTLCDSTSITSPNPTPVDDSCCLSPNDCPYDTFTMDISGYTGSCSYKNGTFHMVRVSPNIYKSSELTVDGNPVWVVDSDCVCSGVPPCPCPSWYATATPVSPSCTSTSDYHCLGSAIQCLSEGPFFDGSILISISDRA